jgi:microcystin-dependent protein
MEGYIGTIMMCGFNFAPEKYAFCMGGSLAINQNAALYSLLGSTFGGDDRTVFKLPNLGGGRVPGGQGAFPGFGTKEMGQSYGSENCSLTAPNLPSHSHGMAEQVPGQTLNITSTATLYANKSKPDRPSPEDNYCAPTKSGLNQLDSFASAPDATMNSDAIDIQTTGTFNVNNLTITHTGDGVPFPLEQPTLILNFVICLEGLFPSRS